MIAIAFVSKSDFFSKTFKNGYFRKIDYILGTFGSL